MKTYLVTGAAGFIGSNLCLALEIEGAKVVGVDNFKTGSIGNLSGFGGVFIEADTTTPDLPKKLDHLTFDAVFHHGDITDPRYPGPDVYDRNVASFNNALTISLRDKAKLVFASTAGLYGNGPVPMKEDQDKICITDYGRSKLQMEKIASKVKDIEIVGLRYFNVFGPRETSKGRAASMVYHLSKDMKAGKRPRIFEFGEHKRDFVYVADVVKACQLALQAPSGVYNVGTGVETTFNDLVDCLNAVMGTNLPAEYFPSPYDPVTYQAHTVADLTKSRAILKFEPEWPLQKAVKDYLGLLGLL